MRSFWTLTFIAASAPFALGAAVLTEQPKGKVTEKDCQIEEVESPQYPEIASKKPYGRFAAVVRRGQAEKLGICSQ